MTARCLLIVCKVSNSVFLYSSPLIVLSLSSFDFLKWLLRFVVLPRTLNTTGMTLTLSPDSILAMLPANSWYFQVFSFSLSVTSPSIVQATSSSWLVLFTVLLNFLDSFCLAPSAALTIEDLATSLCGSGLQCKFFLTVHCDQDLIAITDK